MANAVVVKFTKTVEFGGALRREGVVLQLPKASADFLVAAGEAAVVSDDLISTILSGGPDFLKGFK